MPVFILLRTLSHGYTKMDNTHLQKYPDNLSGGAGFPVRCVREQLLKAQTFFLRRTTTARPIRPEPNNHAAAGTGTVFKSKLKLAL